MSMEQKNTETCVNRRVESLFNVIAQIANNAAKINE